MDKWYKEAFRFGDDMACLISNRCEEYAVYESGGENNNLGYRIYITSLMRCAAQLTAIGFTMLEDTHEQGHSTKEHLDASTQSFFNMLDALVAEKKEVLRKKTLKGE